MTVLNEYMGTKVLTTTGVASASTWAIPTHLSPPMASNLMMMVGSVSGGTFMVEKIEEKLNKKLLLTIK